MHIEELEEKIKEYEEKIKSLEKKRDLAKIEMQSLEKKLEKYKEKIHLNSEIAVSSGASPTKIG